LAFSRDQEHKVYVQHRMLEHAQELFQWLEKGAYLFVCGDAHRMAKDVEATLHRIVQEQGNMDEKEAKNYIKNLRTQKRYLKDVY
jgi:sulfite reductase (NADPH) flavoprotein alpha-component